jgi:hypothetical protein
MKSKLLKATVLGSAAIAIATLASPVMATTLRYTFANATGTPYCDGLTLTTTNNIVYGGTHTGSCVNPDPAGGYKVKVNGGNNLDIATTYSATDTVAYTFFLYLPGNEWFLYKTVGGVFQQTNSGILLRGAPPAKVPVGAKSAADFNPKGRVDRQF